MSHKTRAGGEVFPFQNWVRCQQTEAMLSPSDRGKEPIHHGISPRKPFGEPRSSYCYDAAKLQHITVLYVIKEVCTRQA